MIGVLIVTHGGTASELLIAARTIVARDLEHFAALSLGWDDEREDARSKIEQEIHRLNDGDGVLVLTDVVGGTPTNLAMAFRDGGQVEIVAGVNLPMVIRLGCLGRPSMELPELARWIQEKARKSICCGQDLPKSVCAPSPCEDGDG